MDTLLDSTAISSDTVAGLGHNGGPPLGPAELLAGRALIPLPEALRLAGCGRTTLYGLINAGIVERKNIGRGAYITAPSLYRLLTEGAPRLPSAKKPPKGLLPTKKAKSLAETISPKPAIPAQRFTQGT